MNVRSKSVPLSTTPAEPVLDAVRRRLGILLATLNGWAPASTSALPGRMGITLCALFAYGLTACVGAGDEPQTSQVAQPILSQVGIERVIPVHYYVLDTPSTPCNDANNVTESVIYGALRDANRTFRAAGVQFNLARIDRLTMPTFRDLRVNLQGYTAPTYSWASVYTELQAFDPTLTSTQYASLGNRTNDYWLIHIANHLTPTEIPVMVPCTDNRGAHAHQTQHELHIEASRVGFGVLRHELGHYFGLRHPEQAGGASALNHEYDLVYGTNAAGTVTQFFSSAAAVAAFRAIPGNRVIRKDGRVDDFAMGGFGTGAFRWSWVDGTTPTTTHSCELQIEMQGTTYRTSTHPVQMRGIQHAIVGAPVPDGGVPVAYSANFMTYLSCPRIDQQLWAIYDMEPSQIEQVRAALRSQVGQRDQLGRGTVRQGPRRSAMVDPGYGAGVGSEVDFDNDNQRDIAYYRPSTGQCVVRESSNPTVDRVIPLDNPDERDIPMLGDYDGDGKTDCATYRPGIAGGWSLWRWRSSISPYAMNTEYFGTTGDIPISDVRFRASSSAYGRYGVFRPSNHTFYWRTGLGVTASVQFGYTGDDLVLGDYDRDGWTDLALWTPSTVSTGGSTSTTPAQSYFTIQYSADNYTTWHAWAWGQETDVPLGAVSRDSDGQLDFAVWRPSNGTWYYLLNPRTNNTSGTLSQQWGGVGDVPMPGFDLDNDGLADEAIWRPAGSGAQIWYRNTATGTSAGHNIGLTGDVPMWVPDTNGDTRPELLIYRSAGTPVGTFHGMGSYMGGYPWYAPITSTMLHSDILL